MSKLFDKFQCKSICKSVSEGDMVEERVYSIEAIAPDDYLDILRTPRSIDRKSSLEEIISAQLKKPESADVTLRIGAEIFKVPIIILQSYSKFFQSFSCHEKEIDMSPSDIAADVFHMIYAWMLSSSKIVGREDLVCKLMGAQVSVKTQTFI